MLQLVSTYVSVASGANVALGTDTTVTGNQIRKAARMCKVSNYEMLCVVKRWKQSNDPLFMEVVGDNVIIIKTQEA